MWNLTRYLLWIVYCGLALLYLGVRFVQFSAILDTHFSTSFGENRRY